LPAITFRRLSGNYHTRHHSEIVSRRSTFDLFGTAIVDTLPQAGPQALLDLLHTPATLTGRRR
jgi:hypothetical protein